LVAAALNRGDLVMAAIAAVQLQFPDPPSLANRAESQDEIAPRAREPIRSGLLKFWDPEKHPRAGVLPNPGEFAPVGEASEAAIVTPVAMPGHAWDKPWDNPLATEGGGGGGVPRGQLELPFPRLRWPWESSPEAPNPASKPTAPSEAPAELPFPGGLPRQRASAADADVPGEDSPTQVPGRGGRLGNTATRAQNAEIAAELEDQGFKITGGGGKEQEEYIEGEGPGTKGGTFVDITAVNETTGKTVRVQTVDTLADGITPTPREQAAIARIRNTYPNECTLDNPEKKSAMTRHQFMGRYQFLFYATARDLTPVLSLLEAQKKLQYTAMRRVVSNRPQTYFSYADIPDFGRTYDPTAVMNPTYLVALQGTVVQVETIYPKTGVVNFAINQGLNKDTVILRPGGMYGRDVLLYGSIGTVSESEASLNLYDFMVEPYLARFAPVREFFLGPEAFDLWKAGVRLTSSATSPANFGLKA
jgi:hypothetical protein